MSAVQGNNEPRIAAKSSGAIVDSMPLSLFKGMQSNYLADLMGLPTWPATWPTIQPT